MFAKTSTAVNPFIYFFMSKGFRKDTWSVFNRLSDFFQSLFQDLIPQKADAGVSEKEDFEKEF